jgi:uncharacterized protein YlaI
MENLRVIALLGRAGSGKDLAGSMLCQAGRGEAMAFADKLKSICGELFGLSHDDMYTQEGKTRPTQFDCLMCPECKSLEVDQVTRDRVVFGDCKLCGTTGDVRVFRSKWTPRTILQYIGTEGFRAVDPSVWVRYTIEQARKALGAGCAPGTCGQCEACDVPQFVVITDCRFRSEAEAIWSAGGEVWRIKRPAVEGEAVGLPGHASEAEQASIADSECQAIIDNSSSLDHLRAQLHVQLTRFLSK